MPFPSLNTSTANTSPAAPATSASFSSRVKFLWSQKLLTVVQGRRECRPSLNSEIPPYSAVPRACFFKSKMKLRILFIALSIVGLFLGVRAGRTLTNSFQTATALQLAAQYKTFVSLCTTQVSIRTSFAPSQVLLRSCWKITRDNVRVL